MVGRRGISNGAVTDPRHARQYVAGLLVDGEQLCALLLDLVTIRDASAKFVAKKARTGATNPPKIAPW